MAMYKKGTFSYRNSIKPLNEPNGEGWDLYDFPNQIKTASKNIDSEDLGGFDLKQAKKEHPDFLFVKIFAIKKDEPNDNGDAFSEEELKKAANTFVGVPLFTNHQNDDVEKARGECVHSWYDEKDGGIYIVGRVDKVAYPRLARGIETGYVTGTSMGCFLGHNRVLMSDGSYKEIKDVRKNDKVITHKGNIRRVKNLQMHEDKTDDLIYKIKVEGLPNEICATKEHPFYILKEQTKCYITGQDIGSPKSMKNRYRRRTKKGVYQQEEYQVALKNGELDKFDFEWKEAEDLKEGDMVSFPISKEVIDDSDATIDKARLIGYFLAEGSYLKYKGYRTAVEFNLCLSKEKDTLGKEIIGLLRKVFDTPLEPKIHERPDKDILMIRLYGKNIAKWFFDYCGEYSHKKKLNEKCLLWDPNIQKHILAAWINGDGTCRNIYHRNGGLYQNISGTTCSEILHNQMKFIASRLGVYSITEQREEWAKKRGKKPYWNLVFGCKESQKLNDVLGQDRIVKGEYKDSWFRQADNYIVMPIREIKTEYNEEPVYNIEVEEDHSYIVEGVAVKNCSVSHSICSVCHNRAETADDYCQHVANRKNRKYTGDLKCAYHNSPTDTEDKCPICGSTKNSPKILKHSEQPIYEHNYGLKFIENSFVVNPACHECGVKCILSASNLQKKVASFNNIVNRLYKEAVEPSETDSVVSRAIEKLGGMNELNSLKESMSEMEKVVKSMLKQKENVSMEYVSDLVKAMSDVQKIFDELIEMGYGALPSPQVLGEDSEIPVVSEQFPQPVPPQSQQPSSGGEQMGDVETSDLGGLGNITMPKKSSKNKEDFYKINQSLMNKVGSLEQSIRDLKEKINYQLEIGAKMATENKNTKTAASVDNQEVITEKQLEKQEETLHPRTETTYEGITESKEQLAGEEKSNDTTSKSPQVRKGTYETITEDQLKTESALGDAIIHFNDYPDVITEKQWDDFSRDVAGNIPDDYTEQITQAQIRDLLSKHKFIGNVETITEDQLKNISMTDGLKRWANKNYSVQLVKTANQIIADMISKFSKSPDEIRKLSSLINDDNEKKSKVAFLTIVNSLPYKRDSRKAIASKAQYFSKVASKDVVSTFDALVLAAAEHGQLGMKVEDVLDFVGQVVNNKTAMEKVDYIIRAQKDTPEKIFTKTDAFKSALKEMDKPEDGLYKIKATVEDIGVPITEKEAFIRRVKKFAQEMIDDDSVVSAVIRITANPDGTLEIDVQDGAENEITPDDIGDIIEGPVEDIDADMNGEESLIEEPEIEGPETELPEEPEVEEQDSENGEIEEPMLEDETEECRAEKKEKISKVAQAQKEIKKAQMMGGEMGGQGGVSQAPGAGATLPTPDLGNTPPMQNLSEEPGLNDEEGEIEDTAEPLPPGSICPVCGSDDVDIIGGKGKCNNCGSEMTYKVEINVTKWQGITPSEDEVPEEEGFEGEGFEMPTGEESLGNTPEEEIPAAASVDNFKINKFAAVVSLKPNIVKTASKKHKIGTISPLTGKNNTVSLGDGLYACLDTGAKYKVSYKISDDGKKVYGQWEWQPRNSNLICPSCSRAKSRFKKALASINMSEQDFDKLDISEQAETIIKLKKAGSLKTIKTASKEGSIIEDYKLAYGGYGNKFPIESCIEKLSRRFGKDAVCLSGPDEGKPLAESICNRLKKSDVYTDKIAYKIADAWSDCDGDEECITYQVRSGFSLRQASEICSVLKLAVGDGEDFLADEMAEVPTEEPMIEDTSEPEEEIDPFEDETGGTVSIDLPMELVEQLDEQLDIALGENPEEEAHHNEENLPGESPLEESPLEESPTEQISPDQLETEAPGLNDIGETKPCTEFEDGTGNNPAEECGQIGNAPKSKVQVTMNGKPVQAKSEKVENKEASLLEKTIGRVGKTSLDLSSVMAALSKEAGEKEISQEKAQDSQDIGTYTAGEGGSLMGHENETIKTPQKPSVPRDKATMGQEPDDLNPQDKPQPVIPSDDATMGHEKEVGLDGGDNRYTGGDKGQGKTELASTDEDLFHMRGFGSSKSGLSSLADRLAKKLAPKEPVSKDPDVQPISGNSTIGKEEKFTADDPANTEGDSTESLMGHEKETLDKAPKSPADHPDIFTGNAQQGQEELDSEKTTKDKGTVIASDSESEAYRVAGRMLKANRINPEELASKVEELKTYKPQQIRDIEKSIFAEKGLNTVSDGLSQPVQINETSSVRNSQTDLSSKLASLFSLSQRNQMADSDDLIQLRKAYGK